MDGANLIFASLGGNAVFITISVFVIKSLIKSVIGGEVNKIDGRIDNLDTQIDGVKNQLDSQINGIKEHCKTVSGNIIKTFNGDRKFYYSAIDTERTERKNVDNDLWKSVNTHGHKGLEGNSNKVTRND